MSYVRWSTPLALPEGVTPIQFYTEGAKYNHLPTSDFYIYDHVGGYVSVNLAGNRRNPPEPFTGPTVIDVDPETGCGRPNPDWFAWMDAHREYIDHPDAGESFAFDTMDEAIAAVEKWIAEGFRAPDWLLDKLREAAKDDHE